jgi:hypothetical protein
MITTTELSGTLKGEYVLWVFYDEDYVRFITGSAAVRARVVTTYCATYATLNEAL